MTHTTCMLQTFVCGVEMDQQGFKHTAAPLSADNPPSEHEHRRPTNCACSVRAKAVESLTKLGSRHLAQMGILWPQWTRPFCADISSRRSGSKPLRMGGASMVVRVLVRSEVRSYRVGWGACLLPAACGWAWAVGGWQRAVDVSPVVLLSLSVRFLFGCAPSACGNTLVFRYGPC